MANDYVLINDYVDWMTRPAEVDDKFCNLIIEFWIWNRRSVCALTFHREQWVNSRWRFQRNALIYTIRHEGQSEAWRTTAVNSAVTNSGHLCSQTDVNIVNTSATTWNSTKKLTFASHSITISLYNCKSISISPIKLVAVTLVIAKNKFWKQNEKRENGTFRLVLKVLNTLPFVDVRFDSYFSLDWDTWDTIAYFEFEFIE